MELSINYSCPRCEQIIKQRLQDLAPGQGTFCAVCQEHAVLTVSGLKQFAEELKHYCAPADWSLKEEQTEPRNASMKSRLRSALAHCLTSNV